MRISLSTLDKGYYIIEAVVFSGGLRLCMKQLIIQWDDTV